MVPKQIKGFNMKIRYVPLESVFDPETRAILLQRFGLYNAVTVRELMWDNGINCANMAILCGKDDEAIKLAYEGMMHKFWAK